MPNLDHDFRDKTSPVWDMSQERALVEQVVSQRLHFYLVFISIVIAASLNAKSQFQLQVILTAGSALSWLIAWGLRRTSERLDLILKHLATDESHPLAIINKGLGRTEKGRKNYRDSLYIPCIAISIASAVTLGNYVSI